MKKILLLALVLFAAQLTAQKENSKSFVWGAMAGFETQLLGIEWIPNGEPEEFWAEAERAGYGGSLGVFGRWHIWRGLSVQPALSLSTLQSKVVFHSSGTEHFRFTDLELPLHFVLTNTSDGEFPLRGSLLFGGRLGWNLASQNSENLNLLRERVALDLGIGVEIRLKNWRFQPEFVYSHCLNNLHDVTNARYDWVTGRIVRDRLTLRVLVWKG
jgi:hypothetical protein